RNFRPQSRSDDESYQSKDMARRSDTECGRKVRRPSGGRHKARLLRCRTSTTRFVESRWVLRLAFGPFAAHRGTISFSHTLSGIPQGAKISLAKSDAVSIELLSQRHHDPASGSQCFFQFADRCAVAIGKQLANRFDGLLINFRVDDHIGGNL